MSHFGDPEAHRRILQEMSSLADSGRSMAYLKAAVMGSMGSAKAAAALHEQPGLMECPSRMMRVQLAMLTLTVRAAKGSSRYAQELLSAEETVGEVAAQFAELQGQRRRQQQHQQTQRTTHDTQVSTLPGAAFTASPTTIMSSSRVSTTFSSKESEDNGDVSEEFLYAAMDYVNYMRGFNMLWGELFGAHYFILDRQTGTMDNVAQVPPHLYAVDWQSVLTSERQAWTKGIHETAKNILRSIVMRNLPLDAYVLYVLYAGLSLRVRLLETAAEIFTWSALFVDIPYCVGQLYMSYRTQCEYARLQDVWHSFSLFDDVFVSDCGAFNLECSAAQGAIFESTEHSAGNGKEHHRDDAPAAMASAGTAPTTQFGRLASRHRSANHARVQSTRQGEQQGHDALLGSPGNNNVGGDGMATSEPPGFGALHHTSASDVDSELREANGSDDDTDMEEREEGVPFARAQKKEREVYVPMFHTECRFTWMLQRLFWSLYGRCTLLFGSCICLDLAPTLSPQFVKHSRSLAEAMASRTKGLPGGTGGGYVMDPAGTAQPLAVRQQMLRERHSVVPRALPNHEAPPVAAATSTVGGAASVNSGWTWRSLRSSLARTRNTSTARGPSPQPAAFPPSLSSTTAAAAMAPETARSSVPADAVSALADSFATASTTGDAGPVLPAYPQAPFYFRYTWHQHRVNATVHNTDEEGGEDPSRIPGEGPTSSAPLASPDTVAAAYLREFTFLTQGGCYVLAHAIHLALTSANYPATLMMLSDNASRPGLRHWMDHKYVISAVADEPGERHGIEPWVLNFVLPRFRLSDHERRREMQETAIIDTVVPQLLSTRGRERVSFTKGDSLFYVLNGGPYMDQGRNYFVMHLHGSNCPTPPQRLLTEERANAFGALEEVRLAWYMTCSSNEALRLAAAIGVADR